MNRIAIWAFSLLASAFALQPAMAGRQDLADRGSLNYNFDGQYWFDPESGLSIRINSSFLPLDFDGNGAPAFRDATVDPRGRINFSTGDFFAPMFSATPYMVDPNFLSGITITTGYLAPVVIDPTRPITYDPNLPTYDPNHDLAAVRFWWDSVCTATSPCDGTGLGSVSFQAVLVALGNDSFLLQYNYGFNGASVPRDASASFALGANSASFDGPYDQVGPDYCFNHGVVSVFTTINACTGSVTAVIPEPMSTTLFLTGFGILIACQARRRRPACALVAS